jgi:hypothetical protein
LCWSFRTSLTGLSSGNIPGIALRVPRARTGFWGAREETSDKMKVFVKQKKKALIIFSARFVSRSIIAGIFSRWEARPRREPSVLDCTYTYIEISASSTDTYCSAPPSSSGQFQLLNVVLILESTGSGRRSHRRSGRGRRWRRRRVGGKTARCCRTAPTHLKKRGKEKGKRQAC